MKHIKFILYILFISGCCSKPDNVSEYIPAGDAPATDLNVVIPAKKKIEIVLPEIPYAN